MESNRDEAERCIQIAAQALRDSKLEKAEKFLKKADKLYPTQKAKGNFYWNDSKTSVYITLFLFQIYWKKC